MSIIGGRFLKRRSISGLLLRRLLLLQVATVLIGMFAWMGFSPYVGYEDLAAESAQRRVVASISEDAVGRVSFRPTQDLLEYAAARPGFAFGVLADGKVLAGTSPALATPIKRLAPFMPTSGKLVIGRPGGPGFAKFVTVRTFSRPVTVVTAGNRFRFEDASAFVTAYLPQLLAMFGPALLGAVFVVPLAIHRSLRPLREAADQAAAIDLGSLEKRLPDEGVTRELYPLVAAFNALLERLQDGVARQHLFTSNAAHELRTPVSILAARIDALPNGATKNDFKRDARRLELLLNQLLSVARLGQREVETEEVVDLVACAREVVADCAPLALRSGVSIELETESPSSNVRGNARALCSALANLVDNALRAEPCGGTVLVRVVSGAATDRLRLEVIDHGDGVAETDCELIFEPFWRAQSGPGTGLGLAIVREIVRYHEGRSWVESTPHGGATFIVDLPALPSAANIAASRQARTILSA